jgi:septum formation inhibitor-activating ATPase MinD
MKTTNIIAVSATKGGTGTSTVAALLALSSGVKTLILDQSQSRDLDAILNIGSASGSTTQITDLVDLCRGDDPEMENYELVIIDRGTTTTPVKDARNIFVTRKCYLSLRKSIKLKHKYEGVIVVDEADRALTVKDVSNVLSLPIVGTVAYNPALTRSIDAGLLVQRADNFATDLANVGHRVVMA